MFDDVNDVEDGTVVGRDVSVCGEEEVSSRAASGLGLVEVARIAVAASVMALAEDVLMASSCVAM